MVYFCQSNFLGSRKGIRAMSYRIHPDKGQNGEDSTASIQGQNRDLDRGCEDSTRTSCNSVRVRTISLSSWRWSRGEDGLFVDQIQ